MKRRLAALKFAQRVILVVGLAAGLRVAWRYLVLLALDDGGWFNYAPDGAVTGVTVKTFEGSGVAEWPVLLAIALIAVWTLASVWLFGLPYADRSTASGPAEPAAE